MIVSERGAHLRELDAYAKRHGLTLRLAIEPGGPAAHNPDRPTRLSELALYEGAGKDAEEVEAVYLRPTHTLDDAAGFLLELVKRTPTPED